MFPCFPNFSWIVVHQNYMTNLLAPQGNFPSQFSLSLVALFWVCLYKLLFLMWFIFCKGSSSKHFWSLFLKSLFCILFFNDILIQMASILLLKPNSKKYLFYFWLLPFFFFLTQRGIKLTNGSNILKSLTHNKYLIHIARLLSQNRKPIIILGHMWSKFPTIPPF